MTKHGLGGTGQVYQNGECIRRVVRTSSDGMEDVHSTDNTPFAFPLPPLIVLGVAVRYIKQPATYVYGYDV